MEFYLLNSILELKSGYKLSYNLILKWGTGRSLRSRPCTPNKFSRARSYSSDP